jgi:hypothetical protein
VRGHVTLRPSARRPCGSAARPLRPR